MSHEEFLNLQSYHQSSGLTLKTYLKQIGTSYSIYKYWCRKYSAADSPAHELAPINIRHEGTVSPSFSGDEPPACRCCSPTAFVHAIEDDEINKMVTKFPNMFAIIYGFADPKKQRDILHHVLFNEHVETITTPTCASMSWKPSA